MALPLGRRRGAGLGNVLDGSVTKVMSPKPISSSAPPPVVNFYAAEKRGKTCALGLSKKTQNSRIELESLGEWVSCSVGTNFTPHIITANAGEDVTMKIISFSQQGPWAICVLSANGVISSGRFDILSLTGLFMPSDSGGMRNRSGGMSVSLASPDGRVVGGGVAGLLVATGPVQIVVGSFLAGNQHDQKTKKHKAWSKTVSPTAAAPISTTGVDDPYRTSPSFHADNLSIHPDTKNKSADVHVAVTGE